MKTSEHAVKFIDHLASFKDNSKVMAQLRRCIHPENIAECGRYIYNFLPDDNPQTWKNRCYIAVAALYARHGINTTEKSFGASCSPLFANDSQVRRFVGLLRSNDNATFHRLRELTSILKGVPLNWAELLTGLVAWNHPDRYAQNQFAADFWRSNPKKEEETNEVAA